MDYGWDGKWFLRAYDANSEKVGSSECEEGKIYIEPQGFLPLSGVGVKEGLAEQALKSVEEWLDTKYGITILQPPYRRYHLNLGEISSYPPGYRRMRVSSATTIRGFPSPRRCSDTEPEPSRFTARSVRPSGRYQRDPPHRAVCVLQMIAGKDAPRFGEAKNSWLTGTAAWTFVNISQYIIGIQPTLGGLCIDPCVPSGFGDFTVTRKYRGVTYRITVENPNNVEKGVASMTVDGVPAEGNVIPFDGSKETVNVRVVMG